MSTINPRQCRAARGLLGWSQQKLAMMAGVGRATIAEFELRAVSPMPHTLNKIILALENAGVRLIAAEEEKTGSGVALTWNAECAYEEAAQGDPANKSDDGLVTAPTDDLSLFQISGSCSDLDLYEYWRARPEEWSRLGRESRETLREAIGFDF